VKADEIEKFMNDGWKPRRLYLMERALARAQQIALMGAKATAESLTQLGMWTSCACWRLVEVDDCIFVAKPTRILYGANLSHDRLVKYLGDLKNLAAIQETGTEEKVYNLTRKGIEFLNNFRRVEAFAGAFKFRP